MEIREEDQADYHGLNSKAKLSMAVRSEKLINAKSKRKLKTPQLGCAMIAVVRDFHELVWRLVKPVFMVNAPGALDRYYPAMEQLRIELQKSDLPKKNVRKFF